MIVKLNDVVDRIKGNVDRFNTDLIYYVGGEHYESSRIAIYTPGLLDSEKGATLGFKFHFPFQKGDVLFMARNPHLRKAGMVMFDGICSDASYILRTKDSSVLLQEYLALIVQCDRFWDFFEANKSGSVNYLMNWKELQNYEFDLPSIEEQRKIADLAWAIERTRVAYEGLIRATDELVKSQFMEQFFGPDKYRLVPISSMVDRKIKKKKDISAAFEVIRYIDISSIDNQSKRVTGYGEFPIAEAPSRAQQVLNKGDILISTVRPNLQNIAINPYSEENVVASTGFCVLRCQKCLPEYIWGVITSETFTKAMCEQASGISYPAVRDNDILQYHIPDAPIELQEQFAAFVKQTDKSKFAVHLTGSNLNLSRCLAIH